MRPLSTRAKSESAGVARARMLIKAELWWLSGFPAPRPDLWASASGQPSPGNWIVVPPGGERVAGPMTLDRGHLSRATHTVKKLAGEFPRALPRIVGDVARWVEVAHHVLERLKPLVHRDQPPAANLFAVAGVYRPAVAQSARELIANQPALAPLLFAASWSLALSEHDRAVLTFFRRHAGALAVLLTDAAAWPAIVSKGIARGSAGAVVTALRLGTLAAAEGDRRVAPLLGLLGDPRIHRTPLCGGVEYAGQAVRSLAKRKRGKKAPPWPIAPAPTLARELIGWVDWLCAQDSPTRRRGLRLFELVQPSAAVGEWAAWWQRMAGGVERARAIGAAAAPDRAELARLHTRLHKLRKKIPVPVEIRGLFEVIAREAAAAAEPRHREVVRALVALPDPAGAAHLRGGFLSHWSGLARREGGGDRVRQLCAELAGYLGACERPGLDGLRPWGDVVARWAEGRHPTYSVDDELTDRETRPRDVAGFFRALAILDRAGPDPVDERLARRLVELVRVTHDAPLSAALLPALASGLSQGDYVSDETLAAAVALSSDDRDSFAPLVQGLARLEQGWQRPGALLTSMVARFAGAPGLLRRLCLGVDLHRVVRCGRKLAVLERCGPKPGPQPRLPAAEPELPSWASGYPEALRAPLAALASVDDAAAATAGRLLGRGFADPTAIAAELAAIASKLAAAAPRMRERLVTRRANLEQRLTAPPPPLSASRVARLTGKLERAVAVAVLDQWEARLDAELELHLPRSLGFEVAPDWLLTPEVLDLITPIAELGAADRRLAHRLLAVRAGPPPWDLRDHPANQRFLAGLAARGVVVAPWVDGIGVMTRTASDGRKVHLSLEPDPLKVFQMGGHFETCLSPGGCNYFSVFANAADINKRVVYGRDDDGKVVGRCLLALTGEGQILAFHPYTHDPKLGFAEWVAELVAELADRTRASIAVHGVVPTLVASDWYDDGPVDLAGRFAFLAEGSAFRTELATLPVGELVARLTAELAPRPLDELTLPLILGLDQIVARPELVLPLVPILDQATHLSDEVRLRGAHLLARAGAADAAARLFGDRAAGYLERLHRRHGLLDSVALDLLVGFDPQRGLAVLRATRPRGVRSWHHEVDAERLLAAARATEALHRPKQAVALYRRAAASPGANPSKYAARARLAALAAEADE